MTELLEFCTDLPVESFAAGDVLIAEGSPPTRMLVLVSGSVTVESDGTPFARIDTPGRCSERCPPCSAGRRRPPSRATSDVVVHVVDDPLAFLTERPGAALAVLRTTASRLDGLTQYLVDVKQQFAGLDGHLGMVDGILDALVHHQGPTARPGSSRDPMGF